MNLEYSTWYRDPIAETAMENHHRPFWQHFISLVPECNLEEMTVLDFGCNRGGFLRLLYDERPFHRGIGIDIASDSIAAASELTGSRPLEFRLRSDVTGLSSAIDIAFSYETIYLCEDIDLHARQMKTALKCCGIYYAVTGCHANSPFWPRRRDFISKSSNAPVKDRKIDDYIDAFTAANFDVALRRFCFDGFVPPSKSREFHPSVLDQLEYNSQEKIIFMFSAKQ